MKTQHISNPETNFGKVVIGRPDAAVAVKQSVAGVLILFFFLLATFSASAQSYIRFTLTQERVTVPIGSTNSTVITNNVDMAGGATNANFDVSGLPAGAGAVLTDTNGNALASTTMDTNLWLTINTTNIPEGTYVFRLNAGGFDTNGLPVTNSFPFVLQAAYVWNGSLNASNGWSDAGSWSGGVPGATDDVVFGDQGAQTNNFSAASGIPFTNSFVDTSMTIGSLRFSQTALTNSTIAVASGATNPPAYYHHIQILPGKVLTIAGTNGFTLMRDYFDDAAANLGTMGVTIDGGSGSKLIVSNQNASVTAFVGGSLVPTINMSNLETFIVNVSRVGIADYQLYPNYRDLNTAFNVGRDTNGYSARPRQMSANFYLAKTNLITAFYQDPDNYTNEYSRSYPFSLFNNEQNGVGSSSSQLLLLGITNRFLLDAACFFDANGNGTVRFGFTNGSAVFRNTNGTSRLSVFTVSDDGGTNQAASNIKGIVDFSAGTVDILADRLYLSRDRELIQTNQTPNIQSDLTVGKGVVDVNTAILGFQEHTKPDWTLIGGGQPYLNYCEGRLVVTNGGTFRVNGTLTLGYTADTNNSADAEQYGTYGQITIYSNSIVTANSIVADGGLNFYDPSLHLTGQTPRANNITINQGGNLIVSNSIGANNYTGSLYPTFSNTGLPGLPLDTLTMGSSSILTLFVSGNTNVFVRNLASTGLTPGTIKIASIPNGLGFPTTLPLIHYQSAAPVLVADMSAIGGGVQGYILNDSDNQNIDLFLTTNAPNTLIWTGNQNNNWDLDSLNWVTAVGGVATNFSMGDIVTFDDSSSVTNINIVDVVVPNQAAANGVTITNSAHSYTFNAVGGAIAGTAKIIKQGTNSVIFNAPEAGPVTVTAGEIDVSSSGILGTTTLSSNTVLNVAGGGSVSAGLNSTFSTVTVANGGAINGGMVLQGGSLVNDGTVSVGSGGFFLTNNAVATNNSDGIINLGSNTGGGAAGYEVSVGSAFGNFGTIYCTAGRLFTRGLYFGTGTFYDPVTSGATASALARFEIRSDPHAVLSVGATPSGSIGNMFVQGRFDLSDAANNNNAGGKFLVEVDTVNHINDSITATRWNDLGGCYWVMTNLTGSFSSGQSFNVLVNANGAGLSNYVDTVTLYPTVLPTVPGPGLEWNLTELQNYGTIGVTNSAMIWDGSGGGSWDTNGSTGNWKSGQVYGNNQGAVFGDGASGSTTVTLTTPVAPAGINVVAVTNIVVGVSTNVVVTVSQPAFMPGIVVSNAAKDYTFVASAQTNRITGMTGIYKTGSGTLTVLSSNDFIGGLTIDGGTFAMTNSSALGIANGAALNGGISLPTGISAGSANQIYNQVLIDNNATVKYFGTTNQNLNHFVTINQGGGTFEVSSNTVQLTLNDAILGAGALTKTGFGTLILNQAGDLYAGDTTVSQGTLLMTTAAAGFGGIALNTGTTLGLTNGVGGSAVGITLTNAINITGAGTAINILGISTNVSSGSWSGSGAVTITTTNAANLFVFNGSLSNFSGTVSFGASSNAFRFNNRTNDNPCTGSANATFDLGTGGASLYNFNGGGLTYDLGALAGGPNTILSGRGSNSTVWAATTIYSIGANGNGTTFSGKITNGLDTVSVVKVGNGALLLNGNSTYTGSTTVSNGVLGGTGSIASPLTVTGGGTLSPGNSIGTFTVSNNASLGGAVLMELNQADPATNDMLAVTGTITATGTLVVTNVGPDIINGSTFKLFSQGVTGFSSVTLPATDPTHTKTYVWANSLGASGTIQLTGGGAASAVNTTPTNIVASVSGNTLTLSWPADHTGWTLEAQTNSLAVGINTNWVPIAGSSSTNEVSMTIDPNNGVVFYRLIYQP
ncbi:MAG TPA: autotransporter-associated beta strand repeat-containing protein [Verrucomicrobiae bacterium]|jgi:autotransporter-associated beta strand protein